MSKSLPWFLALALANATAHADWLSYKPLSEPDRPRGTVWRPLLSFVLPGFGQYAEDQWAAGATYTTIGSLGLGLAVNATQHQSDADSAELDNLNGFERQYVYGMQLYMFSGELSAFASFQTAVQSRKAVGQFQFITHQEESVSDLLTAPFQVEHLVRPTTFVPLLLLGTVAAVSAESGDYLNFGDSAFVGGVSYNAGVGEEALFRGYFMPSMRQNWGSDFWSNSTQAVIFGAAHYSKENRFPIAQALMGYYLGWLTQRNGWSIRQSIFVHAWWDVIALGAQIAHENGRQVIARPVPLFSLPF